MSALKFGTTIGGANIAEVAQRAEALGFDSVWMGEHVVYHRPMHDALMLLAAASAATKRVRLGTSILLMPLKHPVLVAKAVTTLDHLSEGRASLGIGVGGEYAKEFEAMGVPVNERGPRTDESIELIKRFWTEERVSFRGRFFHMDDVTIEPKPVQKPHPPILVGGRRGALKRVAKYADGWMPYLTSVEAYRQGWEQIEELATGYGRDPADIERMVYVFVTVGKSYEAAAGAAVMAFEARYRQDFTTLVKRLAIVGTPQQCARRIAEYREAGAEHFILSPNWPEEQMAAYHEVLANEVIPLVKKG